MRAFDVLTKAEVRHPRLDAAALSPRDGAPALDSPAQARAAVEPDSGPRRPGACGVTRRAAGRETRRCRASAPGTDRRLVRRRWRRRTQRRSELSRHAASRRRRRRRHPALIDKPLTVRAPNEPAQGTPAVSDPAALKDAFLSEVRKAKKFFYGTVVAQAQRIDVEADRIVFAFAPQHRALRVQLDQIRAVARGRSPSQLAGRQDDRRRRPKARRPRSRPAPGDAGRGAAGSGPRSRELRQQALADTGVQAMLDVFAAGDQGRRRDVTSVNVNPEPEP